MQENKLLSEYFHVISSHNRNEGVEKNKESRVSSNMSEKSSIKNSKSFNDKNDGLLFSFKNNEKLL